MPRNRKLDRPVIVIQENHGHLFDRDSWEYLKVCRMTKELTAEKQRLAVDPESGMNVTLVEVALQDALDLGPITRDYEAVVKERDDLRRKYSAIVKTLKRVLGHKNWPKFRGAFNPFLVKQIHTLGPAGPRQQAINAVLTAIAAGPDGAVLQPNETTPYNPDAHIQVTLTAAEALALWDTTGRAPVR